MKSANKKWVHEKQRMIYRKLQYLPRLPEQLKNNYWLLITIIDYTREDWGEFSLDKQVDEFPSNCGGNNSKYKCAIQYMSSEEKFWKIQTGNYNDVKYNDDHTNPITDEIADTRFEIVEWMLLPVKSSIKYYFDDDCIIDPENFINDFKGRIVRTKYLYAYDGWQIYWFVPEYKSTPPPHITSTTVKKQRKNRRNKSINKH